MDVTQTKLSKKRNWQPSKSFWITASIWAFVLISSAVGGALAEALLLLALYVVITSIYSLLKGRRSWLGLQNRKAAGIGIGAGFVLLLVSGGIVGATAPQTPVVANAETKVTVPATASPSATPTPAAASVLLTECKTVGETLQEADKPLVCTAEETGSLVWMPEEKSKALLAYRAEATASAAAQQKAAADKVAADKAAQTAAKKAATDKANAEKAAADKATADEAARVAAEQAAQQAPVVQEPPVDAPAGDVFYANCTEAKAAGAAPLYLGQPGYRPKLDGDSDGVACER